MECDRGIARAEGAADMVLVSQRGEEAIQAVEVPVAPAPCREWRSPPRPFGAVSCAGCEGSSLLLRKAVRF